MVVYKFLKSVNEKIGNVLSGVNTVLLAVMTVIIFLQVIFRYVLKAPLSWSEELATYLFSIETFLGAATVLRSNKHVRVTAALTLIKNQTLRTAVDVLCDIVILALCLLLCLKGGQVVAKLMQISQTSPSMPWLKMAYVNLFVPLSMGLMVLIKAEAILGTILHAGADVENTVEGGNAA